MAATKSSLKPRRSKTPKHDRAHDPVHVRKPRAGSELVIITGMSGSGKASVLKVSKTSVTTASTTCRWT